MIRVTFQTVPRDPQSFTAYLSSLNQGASLEGTLNGLVHSSQYREFEKKSAPAGELARAFFLDELSRIQSELPVPLPLSEKSGKPLMKFDFPTGSESASKNFTEVARNVEVSSARSTYGVWFEKSSLPVLKRVLAEAILARIDAAGPELGKWYSESAARLGGAGVDFGLAQRNLSDAEFHRKWYDALIQRLTLEKAKDRVLWESLNREFRILNHLDATKKSAPRKS